MKRTWRVLTALLLVAAFAIAGCSGRKKKPRGNGDATSGASPAWKGTATASQTATHR